MCTGYIYIYTYIVFVNEQGLGEILTVIPLFEQGTG